MQRVEIPVLPETELLQYLNDMFRINSTQVQVSEMDRVDKIFLSLIERLKIEKFSDENEIKLFLESFPNYKLTSELFESIIAVNPEILKYIQCFHRKIWVYQPNKDEVDILAKILKENGDLYRYLSLRHRSSLPLLSIVLSQESCRNSPDVIACIPMESLQLNILALIKIFPDLSEKINNNQSAAPAYNNIKNSFNFQLLLFISQLKWLLSIGWVISFGVLGFISLTYAAAVATVTITPLFLFWISVTILSAIAAAIPIIADMYYIQPLSRAVGNAEGKIVSTLREHSIFNETRPAISGLERDFSNIAQEFSVATREIKMKTVRLSIFNGTKLSWRSGQSDAFDNSISSDGLNPN